MRTLSRPAVFRAALFRAGAGLLAGASLAACSSSHSPSSHSRGTTTTAGVAAQATTTSTSPVTPASTGTIASSTTSTTNPPETTAGGGPITVQSPASGASVGSPLTVSGTSHLGSQAIQVVLSDGSGNALCSATAHPSGTGSFSVTMRFAVSSPGPGSLALYATGSGGARNDLTQVPVQLSD